MPNPKSPSSHHTFLGAILGIIVLAIGFIAGHFAPELASLLPDDSTLADPILRDLESDLAKCEKKLQKQTLNFEACDMEFRGPTQATVVHVTDGDTVKLDSGHTVRILGIDTPELARSGDPAEPFADEATQFTIDHLLDQKVKLERSAIDGNDDHFGRLLRFIWFRDEAGEWQLFEQVMIEQGLAKLMDVNKDMPHVDELRAAQESAQSQQLGIWSVD